MCICFLFSGTILFIGILHDCVLFGMATASPVDKSVFGVELLAIIRHNDVTGLQRLLKRPSVYLSTWSELDIRPMFVVGAPASILTAIGLCGTVKMLACALATHELDVTCDRFFVANLVNCDCWKQFQFVLNHEKYWTLCQNQSVFHSASTQKTEKYLAALLGAHWCNGIGANMVEYAVVRQAPTSNVRLLMRNVYQHHSFKTLHDCYYIIVMCGTDELVKAMLQEEWLDPSFGENVLLRAAQKMKMAGKVALLESDVRVQAKTLSILTV